MQPTYLCSDQHYSLMMGFDSFLSLKILYDAGYNLEPFYYAVDSYCSNFDLVEYVFSTVWGKENVQADEMEIDNCEMHLFRIKVKGFKSLDKKTLQSIEEQAQEVIKQIDNSLMWGDELFEAWYANDKGFEILTYPVNVDSNFTKEIIAFAKKSKSW